MYGIISITELSKVSYINQLFSKVNVSQALHAIAFKARKRCNKGSNNSDSSDNNDIDNCNNSGNIAFFNRDMNLLETIMGAWVVLSTNVNHHHSFVESNVVIGHVQGWNTTDGSLIFDFESPQYEPFLDNHLCPSVDPFTGLV